MKPIVRVAVQLLLALVAVSLVYVAGIGNG